MNTCSNSNEFWKSSFKSYSCNHSNKNIAKKPQFRNQKNTKVCFNTSYNEEFVTYKFAVKFKTRPSNLEKHEQSKKRILLPRSTYCINNV